MPLLVLTADRPPELRDTGASQTIDQIKLYGAAVRWFSEVGVPEDRPGQVAYWRSLACRAFQRSLGPYDPGPVHLNLPFREPLIPDGDTSWCESLEGDAAGPWVRARVASPPVALHLHADPAGRAGRRRRRVQRAQIRRRRRAWPDGRSCRSPTAAPATATTPCPPTTSSSARPSSPTGTGRRWWSPWAAPSLSRPLLNWLKHADEHVVVARDLTRWPDPTRSATQVAQEVEIPVPAGDDDWLHSWRRADTAARGAIDEVLDGTGLSEPRLARDLVDALPNGSLLFSGSSMPIRDLDQAMRPRQRPADPGQPGRRRDRRRWCPPPWARRWPTTAPPTP